MTLVPRHGLVAIVIGPAVWLAFFAAAYLIVGIGCSLDYGEASLAGRNALQLLVTVVGGASALVILAAGAGAERRRRRAREAETGADAARGRFVHLVALLLCGLSFVGILWVVMVMAISPVC